MKSHIVIILKLFISLLILFITFNFLIGICYSKDLGMHPKIEPYDLLIYYKLSKRFSIGDVIVFEKNNKKYISRIIATEGIVVDLSEEGEILVDNHLITETEVFYRVEEKDECKISFPYKVEKDKVFVIGDNPKDSKDSRMFGTIDLKEIKGKVILAIRDRNI